MMVKKSSGHIILATWVRCNEILCACAAGFSDNKPVEPGLFLRKLESGYPYSMSLRDSPSPSEFLS